MNNAYELMSDEELLRAIREWRLRPGEGNSRMRVKVDPQIYLSILRDVRPPELRCDECPLSCCEDRSSGCHCVMDYRMMDRVTMLIISILAVAAVVFLVGLLIYGVVLA